MPASKATLEQRAQAVAVYQAKGLAAAARETGVPKPTLHRWAAEAGLDTERLTKRSDAKTAAATQTRQLSMAERRAVLAERLLSLAETELDRMRAPVNETRVAASGKVVTWTEAEPSPQDRRAIATTAAILLDKSLLLSGEVTSRSETISADDARRRLIDQFPGVVRVLKSEGPDE